MARISWRGVGLFVLLDLVTYVVVYWVLLSVVQGWLTGLDSLVLTGLNWVVSALRLVWVGVIVLRSVRRRSGFVSRVAMVPTAVAAGLVAYGLQFLLGLAASLVVSTSPLSWKAVGDLVQWVGYPLLAVLLVAPTAAPRSSLPAAYRHLQGPAQPDRWS